MRTDLTGAVERLTGCRLEAALSANDVDSDVAAELFVLERPAGRSE